MSAWYVLNNRDSACVRECMCARISVINTDYKCYTKKVEMSIRLYLQRNSHYRQMVVFMMCMTMFRTCMPTLTGKDISFPVA